MNMTTQTIEIAPRAEMDRVRAKTAPRVNEFIDDRTVEHLCNYVGQSNAAISQRIEELDREWDIERWLETNASSLAFTGLALGITVNRKWFWLPALVLPFLLLHATHGWCPPVPLLRRFGVRTRSEINAEKYALKILRGDFDGIPNILDETLRAVEAFTACAS
jgi:hypothetical protein